MTHSSGIDKIIDPYEKSRRKTRRYKKIKKLLKAVYDYDSFRSKQYEIINKIVCGKDVCAILPTSHGKSICFQLPALYLDKPAIIVSPLISLMDDQKMILEELGITTCCYNSTVRIKKEMKKDILEGKYQFVYITPESLVGLENFLAELEKKQGISLIAIDEAHCISSYGFDFRKSYRELANLKKWLPNIPILAVTATATDIVGKDICKVLDLETKKIIKTSFDRPNLYIEIRRKKKNIDLDIIPIVKKYPKKSIIIYCLTIKETEKIGEMLKTHQIKCGVYHSGIDPTEKEKIHAKFIKNKIKIIVATIAFGMGINKSNVRVIIHYGSPKNIEGYYQEIGRAGRDGKKAYCYLLYSARDFMIQKSFINDIANATYRNIQLELLKKMEQLINTRECRRKPLLGYFDEDYDRKCNFCDNCCGKSDKNESSIVTVEQNIQKEAKLLIGLIESIENRTFGATMYVNILRGSANKSIPLEYKKGKYYGKGKYKSVDWWKELIEKLIELGYLQQICLPGRFGMAVIKVSQKGLTWANMADLGNYLNGINIEQLGPIKMSLTN